MVEPDSAYFRNPPPWPSSSAPAWRSEHPIIPTPGAKAASRPAGERRRRTAWPLTAVSLIAWEAMAAPRPYRVIGASPEFRELDAER